jgi:hypothetical protein
MICWRFKNTNSVLARFSDAFGISDVFSLPSIVYFVVVSRLQRFEWAIKRDETRGFYMLNSLGMYLVECLFLIRRKRFWDHGKLIHFD